MTWALALIGFSALIILHEFGHFIVAKLTGMRVERFFLFFPPKVWSVRRGETEYGIGAIPLGGFVKITGMNPDEIEPRRRPSNREGSTPNDLLSKIESAGQEDTDHLPDGTLRPELMERAYYNQPVWKRIAVILAGPVMNILIAFLILLALGLTIKEPDGSGVKINSVQEDSPAVGNLHAGDEIVSVDGVPGTDLSFDERAALIRAQINSHGCAGGIDPCTGPGPVHVVVRRDGKNVPVALTPKFDEDTGRNLLGVSFEPAHLRAAHLSVAESANFAVDRMWFVTSQTAHVFSRILDPEQRKQINGTVGAYEITRQAISIDWRFALGVLAVISLSLGLLNLLPFLPLDGGHIFWSVAEKIRGRRFSFEVMERSGAVGFVLILMIALIGLSNDLGRIFSGEGFNVR
jgi:regulator of sigma E protease